MQAARLHAFGPAAEALRVEDVAISGPGDGEILLEMLAAPINPADLNIVEGKYGKLPALPAIIGNEGVGRVRAVGCGVTDFAVGDLALPMAFGTWCESMVVKAASAIRLPKEIDVLQAAMLTVNPPTAWLMLERFVTLEAGDWVVQNAANSAVGRCVIQIARARGVRTLNVVRRPELIDELRALGGDIVVTEETDLRETVRSLDARPALALNAVGGPSALHLANALADGGTHVTYGAMGRQPLKIPNGLLIFRGINFTGFWLTRWKDQAAAGEAGKMLSALGSLVQDGKLHMAVDRIFPLREIHAACEAAAAGMRGGKVMVQLAR